MTEPTLCHVAWHATDLACTRAFLSALFGWEFSEVDASYWVARPASGAWVGLTLAKSLAPGCAFVPHVSVDDLDEYLRRARLLEECKVVEEGTIPGVCRFADLRDPDGSHFTLVQFKGDA